MHGRQFKERRSIQLQRESERVVLGLSALFVAEKQFDETVKPVEMATANGVFLISWGTVRDRPARIHASTS
jgi:hypothetical protein